MSLYEDIIIWQEKLHALLEEGNELANRADELEQHNIRLQQQLSADQYKGFEALSDLYDDGFHICPANFGQSREEDCLFCLNFLLHKGKKNDA